MPTSLLALAPFIVTYVGEVARELERPITILDVGPGFGRYGLLIREHLDGIHPGLRIDRLDAVEAEARYLHLFPWLDELYDHVFVDDVLDLPVAELDGYDLVLMLDVIEHLEKPAAMELLETIRGAVLIATPRDYFQNPEALDGWPTEDHRSHWTPEDFGTRVDRFDVNAFVAFGAVLVRLAPLA
jgi:2-polyprenyl-3-methyl-5-hydroxy-6-metoxy-1,4-benzoquinol methylase